MEQLIGRATEIEQLNRCYDSGRAELVIVYGRRRIGKTFLVRQLFRDKFTFTFVGGHNETRDEQLSRFAVALQEQWRLPVAPRLGSWSEAFIALQRMLEAMPHDARKLIFLDEMPWMDSPRSRFVTAIESFWNGWAATRSDVMLMACGSSTSWMVKKVLENQGGLYGRVTRQIYLRPFTLRECEQMIESRHGQWDRYQITQAYMALGGVPYYFDMLDVNRSFAENIDRLFFAPNAQLAIEFGQLYASLFSHADGHIAVVKSLAKHPDGLTRDQLSKLTGMDGGGLTTVLLELTRCDMIEAFSQFDIKTRTIYRLVDFFTLFYFRFVAGNNSKDASYWQHNVHGPAVYNWQGHAFEIVGLTHIDQIKHKLGIAGVATSCFAWRGENAQIDLVIKRADRMINLCEMKFAEQEYEIDKSYAERLRGKCGAFRRGTGTRYGLLTTLVTTFGVARNKYSYLAQGEVTLDDLFA